MLDLSRAAYNCAIIKPPMKRYATPQSFNLIALNWRSSDMPIGSATPSGRSVAESLVELQLAQDNEQ